MKILNNYNKFLGDLNIKAIAIITIIITAIADIFFNYSLLKSLFISIVVYIAITLCFLAFKPGRPKGP